MANIRYEHGPSRDGVQFYREVTEVHSIGQSTPSLVAGPWRRVSEGIDEEVEVEVDPEATLGFRVLPLRQSQTENATGQDDAIEAAPAGPVRWETTSSGGEHPAYTIPPEVPAWQQPRTLSLPEEARREIAPFGPGQAPESTGPAEFKDLENPILLDRLRDRLVDHWETLARRSEGAKVVDHELDNHIVETVRTAAPIGTNLRWMAQTIDALPEVADFFWRSAVRPAVDELWAEKIRPLHEPASDKDPRPIRGIRAAYPVLKAPSLATGANIYSLSARVFYLVRPQRRPEPPGRRRITLL